MTGETDEITDEERREVARKLRAAREQMEEEAPPASLGGAMAAYLLRIAKCVGVGIDGNVFRRLADLIDRTTCRNVHGGREFKCSRCGMTWRLLDKAEPLEEWAHVRNPPFCPSCGAKVERD